jgi:hypothetical protein
VDAEKRVGAKSSFIQCETGVAGSLCEGTEGSVVDPSRISPRRDLTIPTLVANTRDRY